MKVKLDFVTNSSSACYVMSLKSDLVPGFEDFMNELDKNPDHGNEGVRIYETFHTLKELQEYVNGGPYDWASKPMGLKFNNWEEGTYLQVKEIIDEGHVAVYCAIDYNACEEFDDSIYSGMAAVDMC